MHHARAHDLDPARLAADAAAIAGAGETVDGHVHARLDEREVVAAEAHPPLLPEDQARELVQRALKVGERDAPVHRQSLYLEEVPLVRGVGGLVPVALARHDHAHRRLLALHDASLHGRSVRAQQHWSLAGVVLVVQPESVPHVARRVVLRDVEHLEVVVVPLHLWAFDHLESHRNEGVADLSHDQRGGMQTAHGRGPTGQRYVDGAILVRVRAIPGGQSVLSLGKGALEVRLRAVGRFPSGPALVRRQRAHGAEQPGQVASPAQECNSPRFQVFGRFYTRQRRKGIVPNVFNARGGAFTHPYASLDARCAIGRTIIWGCFRAGQGEACRGTCPNLVRSVVEVGLRGAIAGRSVSFVDHSGYTYAFTFVSPATAIHG